MQVEALLGFLVASIDTEKSISRFQELNRDWEPRYDTEAAMSRRSNQIFRNTETDMKLVSKTRPKKSSMSSISSIYLFSSQRIQYQKSICIIILINL